MDIYSGVILGVVQGVTEFLPISSSGHLILARELLGLNTEFGLAVDALLQLATVLAVGIYFNREIISLIKTFFSIILRKEVASNERTLFWAVFLGSIPAVIVGLLLEEYMETVFRSALLVACMLIVGSALFYIAERFAQQKEQLSWKKGFLIGIFQALALLPGVSRSGATISGGLLLGLTREEAARFSFVLSFPIILGSGLKKFFELGHQGLLASFGTPLFVSSLVAFVVGILSIHYLIRYLRTHTLLVFIWYRLALAALVLVVLFYK